MKPERTDDRFPSFIFSWFRQLCVTSTFHVNVFPSDVFVTGFVLTSDRRIGDIGCLNISSEVLHRRRNSVWRPVESQIYNRVCTIVWSFNLWNLYFIRSPRVSFLLFCFDRFLPSEQKRLLSFVLLNFVTTDTDRL